MQQPLQYYSAMKQLSLTDAAKALGVDRATVWRWRAKLGVGTLVGKYWVLTASDVSKIRKAMGGK